MRTSARGYIIINVPPVLWTHTPTHTLGVYDESQITPPVHQNVLALQINTQISISWSVRKKKKKITCAVNHALSCRRRGGGGLTWVTFITFSSASDSVLWSALTDDRQQIVSKLMDNFFQDFNAQSACLELQGIEVTPLTLIFYSALFLNLTNVDNRWCGGFQIRWYGRSLLSSGKSSKQKSLSPYAFSVSQKNCEGESVKIRERWKE